MDVTSLKIVRRWHLAFQVTFSFLIYQLWYSHSVKNKQNVYVLTTQYYVHALTNDVMLCKYNALY